MSELDAIFDDKSPAPVQETQPVEAPPIAPELAEAAPEPEAAQPEIAPPAVHQDRNVPLAAMLDERDKRKAAERERDELRAAQAARQSPAEVPDPYDDPDGFKAHIGEQLANQALSQRFDISETMARDKHGDDVVTAAMEWGANRAQTNPGFRDEFLSQKNPIDWVVRQQKRDATLADVGDDPDAYVRRRAAELGFMLPDAGAGAVSVPGQVAKPAAPPRSIASAASTGGQREVAMDSKAAMDAIFKR